MNILNQPINPGGQPLLAAAKETGSGFHDARQLVSASVRFDGLTHPSTACIGRCCSPRWQAQTLRRASNYVGAEDEKRSSVLEVLMDQRAATIDEQMAPPFQPHTLNFLRSFLDKEKMSTIADHVVEEGTGRPSQAQPLHALRVVVSSAVKLDARQTGLIARKMQRITGFVNLALENVIDPSLIAGFVICYGQDESQIIDLSVKGQLAVLKNRVESFEQRTYHHGDN